MHYCIIIRCRHSCFRIRISYMEILVRFTIMIIIIWNISSTNNECNTLCCVVCGGICARASAMCKRIVPILYAMNQPTSNIIYKYFLEIGFINNLLCYFGFQRTHVYSEAIRHFCVSFHVRPQMYLFDSLRLVTYAIDWCSVAALAPWYESSSISAIQWADSFLFNFFSTHQLRRKTEISWID